MPKLEEGRERGPPGNCKLWEGVRGELSRVKECIRKPGVWSKGKSWKDIYTGQGSDNLSWLSYGGWIGRGKPGVRPS